MNRPESKKLKSRLSRAAGESAVVAPAAAAATDVGSVVGACGAAGSQAPVVGTVGVAPEAGGAPGAGGLSTHRAPAAGGVPAFSAHATGPWWQAAALGASFPVHTSPGSSVKYKSGTPNPAHVMDVEDSPKQHPVGHKKTKDECNGKRPGREAISAIEQKLDKFIEVSNKAEKMAEVQQSLASKNLEAAKINHKLSLYGRSLEVLIKIRFFLGHLQGFPIIKQATYSDDSTSNRAFVFAVIWMNRLHISDCWMIRYQN